MVSMATWIFTTTIDANDDGPFRATPRKDRMTPLGHDPTFATLPH
jgi:hypothetical protein